MPMYDYKAMDVSGKTQKGMVEADTQKTARQKLKKLNLRVTEMRERNAASAQSASSVPFFGGRVGVKEIAMMTRQLASLVKANIPLVECLNALVDQTENQSLKLGLSQVRQDVNEGISLAKAFGKHPKLFDTIFINMVEAGESSGTLGLVLLKLADLKEAQMRLRSKVQSAMTYPALMMVVAATLVLVIFTFVIPKLAKVFDNMNKPMPLMTRILIELSSFITTWWFVIGIVLFFGLSVFLKTIRSETGRPKWDALVLRAPIFGPIIRMVAVTRFASTMSTLLASGVPILTAMAIAKNLVGNIPIANAIANARENITEGQSIAEPLRRSGEFPPLVIHMISIGEKTGELPDMLRNISETYEEQVSVKIETMTSLLEPIMIVGMGLVVGFIVFAIFVPLLDISNIS
jgi:general secretion pathway protein F